MEALRTEPMGEVRNAANAPRSQTIPQSCPSLSNSHVHKGADISSLDWLGSGAGLLQPVEDGVRLAVTGSGLDERDVEVRPRLPQQRSWYILCLMVETAPS